MPFPFVPGLASTHPRTQLKQAQHVPSQPSSTTGFVLAGMKSLMISSASQMKHRTSSSSGVSISLQGDSKVGLQPQPLGTAVPEISTPEQALPLKPTSEGKYPFCTAHSVLSAGFPADLQLLTSLKSQQESFSLSHLPQEQFKQKTPPFSSGTHPDPSGQMLLLFVHTASSQHPS